MTMREILVRFASMDALLTAQRTLDDDGWTIADTFTPVPMTDDTETTRALQPRSLPTAALIGGLLGGIACFAMEYIAAVWDYPILVGGRPLDSLIAFVPPAVETALFGAAAGIVVAFFFTARLPRFHHPLFDIDDFATASDDGYFMLIQPIRGKRDRLEKTLRALDAISIHEVGRDD
jgi:Protein of unknown function (DUF3341)